VLGDIGQPPPIRADERSPAPAADDSPGPGDQHRAADGIRWLVTAVAAPPGRLHFSALGTAAVLITDDPAAPAPAGRAGQLLQPGAGPRPRCSSRSGADAIGARAVSRSISSGW